MRLSIVTINLNNKQGLKLTIESVINNKPKDFEFIIIDGGSIDGSVELINRYRSDIDIIVIEKDNGIYDAMNKGIAKAKGEYLFFLNSGDVFADSHVLSKVQPLLGKEDIVYGDIIKTDGSKVIYPEFLKFGFFYTNTICQQAVFFKKSLFDKFGIFDEKLKLVSDWKFLILTLFKYKVSYKHIDLFVCMYDTNGISSSTNNLSLLIEERKEVLNSYFKEYVEDYNELEFSRYVFKKIGFKFLYNNYRKIKKIVEK
jgi:glycosyltransferase involved in cell wall biosynthesis